MADFAYQFSDVKLDSAGIIEVCKSAGMQSVLGEQALAANQLADEVGYTTHKPRPRPHYAHGVDVLDFTAVGWVGTGDHYSRIDEAYHHTLESINH